MSAQMRIEDAVSLLVEQHDKRARFGTIRNDFPFNDLETAYEIQDGLVARLLTRSGSSPVGYKIGLTTARMQQMCGIPHPIAGVVLGSRVRSSGQEIRVSDFVRLGVEFEIAVRIGRDVVPDATITRIDELSNFVDAVAPALELVEDRAADYANLDMLTIVADNSWNAGVVLGEFRRDWPDLGPLEGIVEQNGSAVDRGFGRDVLGHPFEPLLWLCRHLRARGAGLKAGEIVMTGSLVTTRFPSPGDRYRFTLAGLGSVEATFAA